MESKQEVANTLNEAADYLLIHGWIKDSWGEDGGPRCIMGAIHSIEKEGYPWGSLSNAAGALAVFLDDFPQYWNDQTCLDDYEAIDCLKHAAKAVANGEVIPVPLFVFAEDQANLEMSA